VDQLLLTDSHFADRKFEKELMRGLFFESGCPILVIGAGI
jgi:hypothetical protein